MEGTIEELPLFDRIINGFAKLEESSFLPETITSPIENLMAARTFAELAPLVTTRNHEEIAVVERTIKDFDEKYKQYQRALRDTQNVFSSDVDYI